MFSDASIASRRVEEVTVCLFRQKSICEEMHSTIMLMRMVMRMTTMSKVVATILGYTVPQKRVHMFFFINLIGLYLTEY